MFLSICDDDAINDSWLYACPRVIPIERLVVRVECVVCVEEFGASAAGRGGRQTRTPGEARRRGTRNLHHGNNSRTTSTRAPWGGSWNLVLLIIMYVVFFIRVYVVADMIHLIQLGLCAMCIQIIQIERQKMNVKTNRMCCASQEMTKTYYWTRLTVTNS